MDKINDGYHAHLKFVGSIVDGRKIGNYFDPIESNDPMDIATAVLYKTVESMVPRELEVQFLFEACVKTLDKFLKDEQKEKTVMELLEYCDNDWKVE